MTPTLRFQGEVSVRDNNALVLDDDMEIKVIISKKDPAMIPWKDLQIYLQMAFQ
jgi:hypothetical protein